MSPRADVYSKLAIFDGKELTFEESDWFIVNFIRMLWRYGFYFIRMNMWVEGILDKFMRFVCRVALIHPVRNRMIMTSSLYCPFLSSV